MLTPGPLPGKILLIFPGQPEVMASLKPSLTAPTPQPHSSQAEQAAPLRDPQTSHPSVALGTASYSQLANSWLPSPTPAQSESLRAWVLQHCPSVPLGCEHIKPAPLLLSSLRAPNHHSSPPKLLQHLPSSHKDQRHGSFPSLRTSLAFWEMSHPSASPDH